MDVLSGSPLPPEFLARFEVLRRLGSGGLSSVYLVQERANPGFPMAFKLLDPGSLDADNLKRFRNEFEVLTTLRHPNLIEAYELIETRTAVGYLMEYVEGRNMLEVLRTRKPSHSEVDLVFSQLLSALFELHQNGLAHRDIKLENVLVRDDGFIKLSDLGLLKQVGGTKNTETGVLLGTSQYLPPEYVKHSVYDARSDLYAVGLMLFECLAGKRWLEGKQGAEAIRYLCEINFEFPKLALAGLPYKYQRILETVLSVQPWKRYESAEAMRRAVISDNGDPEPTEIIEVAQHLDIQVVKERRKTAEMLSIRARRKKMMAGLAGLLGAASLTVAIGIAGSNQEPAPNQVKPKQVKVLKSSDETAELFDNSVKKPLAKRQNQESSPAKLRK